MLVAELWVIDVKAEVVQVWDPEVDVVRLRVVQLGVVRETAEEIGYEVSVDLV